jgi:hypothetical protein
MSSSRSAFPRAGGEPLESRGAHHSRAWTIGRAGNQRGERLPEQGRNEGRKAARLAELRQENGAGRFLTD